MCRVFEDKLPRNFYWSRRERKLFQARTAQEVHRIKYLINIYFLERHAINTLQSGPTLTAGCAIKHLIEQNILSVDGLIGLESYITEGLTGFVTRRKEHVRLVLEAQNEMKKFNEFDPDELAKIASANSSNDVHKARRRALLAV